MSASVVDPPTAHVFAPVRSATRPPWSVASAARPASSARSTPATSASARSRSATTSRRSPASRSRPAPRTSGATSSCCRCPPTSRAAPTWSPASPGSCKADNLARELGLRSLQVKDDSGNPTHSFKDRVVAMALSAARELDAKVFACPSTGNLANAVAAAGARAGIRTVVFIPHDLEPAKIQMTAVYGGSLVAVRGLVRRRQPARLRDRRRGGGLGVRQRQRPSLLRRGLQDAGLRDRRAARLAHPRPGRHPGRQRLAADQDRQGLPGARSRSVSSRTRPTRSSAPRRRAARRSARPSRPATTSYAR